MRLNVLIGITSGLAFFAITTWRVRVMHHRNDVARLEASAVKAVLDGYNAGIRENRGHVI